MKDCPICHKKYDDHLYEDWAICTKEVKRRVGVINSLVDTLKQAGHNIS